jgi:hypothetical protein
MPLTRRLWHARYAARQNAYGPTPEQRESLQIARDLYSDVKGELSNLYDVEYAALKEALNAAGVPWSPGRGVQ